MPVQPAVDHNLKLVHTVCTGLVTLEEINQHQNSFWLEPSIYGYNELFDLADADFSHISYADLINLAQNSAKRYMLDINTKIAFLTSTKFHEELVDFYIAAKSLSNSPSRTIKRFISRNDAISWLTTNHCGQIIC